MTVHLHNGLELLCIFEHLNRLLTDVDITNLAYTPKLDLTKVGGYTFYFRFRFHLRVFNSKKSNYKHISINRRLLVVSVQGVHYCSLNVLLSIVINY